MPLHPAFSSVRERMSRPFDGEPPLVLVVDPDRDLTLAMAEQLRRRFRVRTALSGEAALEVVQKEEIVVLVSDHRMPGMTGAELLARVAESHPATVRILVTGYPDVESLIDAVNRGHIYSFLTKPWEPHDLETAVVKAAEHHRLRAERETLVDQLRMLVNRLEERVAERTRELEGKNRVLEETNARLEHTLAELAEAKRVVEEAARTDALTGLANRRSIDERLVEELARAQRLGQPFSVVLLDIDHFKSVNDTLGHATGDAVLRAVGGLLRRGCRPYDLPGRWGGEELLLVLPGLAAPAASLVAERLRAALEALHIEGVPRQVTASFGVATWRAGDTPLTLVKRTDEALYTAKRSGRNRVEVAG